jgi:hypothetical protein
MSDYDAIFDHALSLMESGSDLTEAVSLWDRLAESLPESELVERGLLSLNKAVCLVELGRPAEAITLCWDLIEKENFPLEGDLGQQLSHLVMEQSRMTGDLGKARSCAEKALAALEGETTDCSPETLLAVAQQRAHLARDMGQPDDAEETLATVLELLTALLKEESLDAGFREELQITQAQLLETRAHNRFEGHANEIASLDLEDAVNIYLDVLGPEHQETRRVQELLLEVSGNY